MQPMRHKSENSLFLDEKETNGPHTQYEKKDPIISKKKRNWDVYRLEGFNGSRVITDDASFSWMRGTELPNI